MCHANRSHLDLFLERWTIGASRRWEEMCKLVSLTEEPQQIVATVRRFIVREVKPVASEMEHRDEYPHGLVERMRELGLCGAIIPTQYGGLGVSFTTYAMIIEEICRGWMSLSGVL